MVISFQTADLRLLCEDQAAASAAYNVDASQLMAALADLDAAPSLLDLPYGTVLIRDDGRLTIEYEPIVLVFVPNHKKLPLDDNGHLDQGKVMRVKVMEIERRA